MNDRIMVAALRSGSGKTMLTCGLLQAFKERGLAVSSFKCGPDYIDPMFHRKVIGVPSHNLDTFFSGGEQIRELFRRGRNGTNIAVIEGVMGLFDGLGGVKEEGSSYHLAKVLNVPILLVVDVQGMGRTILPVLSGVLSYDKEHFIKGVILNRTTRSFYETIAPLIEERLTLPVCGFIPKMPEISLESRHLGLKMPREIDGLKRQLQHLADRLGESLDMEQILAIAAAAPAEPFEESVLKFKTKFGMGGYIQKDGKPDLREEPVRIAVAQDEAFNFYYEENLRMLREAGADLIPFSPLHDPGLPENVSGILLGGGYPELCGKELSQNISMRAAIRDAIGAGMPSVAECGGFMYLQERLTDADGVTYEMVGAAPGGSRYTGNLVRFGYVELIEKEPCFLSGGGRIRAHEFHYFDSDNNGDSVVAVKPATGKSWDCVMAGKNRWWGYPHLYYPSNPDFAEHFVFQCRDFTKRRNIL